MAKFHAHHWFTISRGLAITYCGRCGILALRNRACQKVMERSCTGGEED